jgi:hypothetical protein
MAKKKTQSPQDSGEKSESPIIPAVVAEDSTVQVEQHPAPAPSSEAIGNEPKPAQMIMIGVESLEEYNARLLKRAVREGIATVEFKMPVPMTVYIRDAISKAGVKISAMQAFHVQPGQYIQVGSTSARDYLLRLTFTNTTEGRAKENFQVPMFEVVTDTLPREEMFTNPMYIQR